MEGLMEKERQALRDAVAKERKEEEFERSLGRAMRALGLDYDAYIQLVSRVRDESRTRKTSLEEAATILADEKE